MTTQLDPGQVLKTAFNDNTSSLNVSVVGSGTSLTTQGSYVVPFSSINGSGGSVFQIVASTSNNISLCIPNEQTGVAMNLYTGGSGSEVLLFIIAPGQDNEVSVNIPAGTRLSIRANGASAPTAGSVYLTFVG